MTRFLRLVPLLLGAAGPVGAEVGAAAVGRSSPAAVGVSPGGRESFLAAEACPSFSWTAVAEATGYELRAYGIRASGELVPLPALEARLPAGATSWTPPADRCLVAGERYGWSVRPSTGTDRVRGEWSQALLFEVAEDSHDLAVVLEVVRRHLGPDALAAALTAAEAAAATPAVSSRPDSAEAEEGLPPTPTSSGPDHQGAGPSATAVRGEVPDGAGETYGVRGVSSSPDGAGVRADNNNAAGADLVLGGSPIAELTETSFSRESAGNVTFAFTNPGAGAIALEVDGTPVFHAGNDGAGSGLDADLLDGLDSTAFLGSGTDDWVDETGDTMTGTLALSPAAGDALTATAGDLALHGAATVTKAGARFLWDDTGSKSFAAGRAALAFNGGFGNTAVGTAALDFNSVGSFNTAVGIDALGANTFGGHNTAVGAYALDASDGDFNTASGHAALGANTSGGGNTAVGAYALDANTGAHFNTAVGFAALGANTAGGEMNAAVGAFALEANVNGVGNAALGSTALRANTTGSSNTAVGARALDASTTANSNTALGRDALGTNTTGAGNIAIGYRAGFSVTTTGNNVFIDSEGDAGDADHIRIGDTQTETHIAGIFGNVVAGGATVMVGSTGDLGTLVSSRRFKEDIADVGELSERLLALRPISFRYTEEAAGRGERPLEYGLIAEEVAEAFPELVAFDEAGAPFTVRYHLLVPLLLNELQRERARAQGQERELAAQRASVARQDETLQVLLARLERLERERRPRQAARP